MRGRCFVERKIKYASSGHTFTYPYSFMLVNWCALDCRIPLRCITHYSVRWCLAVLFLHFFQAPFPFYACTYVYTMLFPLPLFFSVSLFRYYFCCLFVCSTVLRAIDAMCAPTRTDRQLTLSLFFIFRFFSYGYYYVCVYVCVCVSALSDVREKLRRCVSWLVYALTGRDRGARLSVYGCVRAFLLPRPA